jgi:hypothetical protein
MRAKADARQRLRIYEFTPLACTRWNNAASCDNEVNARRTSMCRACHMEQFQVQKIEDVDGEPRVASALHGDRMPETRR